ncbi:MAG: preprotein translocase subunit SecE [Alphaproteobacteria bacterium]|nr:preprotein translocase subunit SecE [Alphaproteobacteria bacterium]
MAKTSPAEFVRQVRQEVSKVTFPTRRETMISATMVLIMVVLAGIFFLITDNVIQFFLKLILGFGS